VTQSISFDHAADFYDATRALPPEVHQRLTDVLARELEIAEAERVLEVGIGTGRIARPLGERGVRVCGVDIAPRMLARLREQLGPGHTEPDLVLGDATRLPLADGSFRAVIICHILHLVSDWSAAIMEIRRVLAPGGALMHIVEAYPGEDRWRVAREVVDGLLRERGFVRSRRAESQEIDAALSAAGGRRRVEPVAERGEMYTPAGMLALARNRVHSWTWEIPDALLQECLDIAERWARERFGSLDTQLTSRVANQLHVWSFS
jgi:SAM-dependent methyltransferase